MILDFEPSNGNYILRAPFDPERVKSLKDEYGLDFWPTVSTAREAVFSTKFPYAAAPFWQYANDRARGETRLQWICREIELSRTTESGSHYDVPADQELSSYQNADLDYMLARDGGVLDADEPGLGKTPTAIAYANEIRAARVLIVCPAQIRIQWLERWREWSTMPRYLPAGSPLGRYSVQTSRGGVNEDAAVIAVSYELAGAAGLHEALMRREYDLLILDEAHFLKTASAARTRAIFGGKLKRKAFFPSDENPALGTWRDQEIHTAGLASRCRRVIALTGTPLPNRPREAHVLAHNLCPESIDFLSERAFGDRFNPREIREVEVWDQEAKRFVHKRYADESSGRHAELQARLRAHFMCRHLKREVLTQLKLPSYDLIRAEETAPVKAALRAEKLLDIDPDTLAGAHADVLGHIAEARRMMGIALAPQAIKWAEYLLNDVGIEKLTIFYWHIEVGELLERGLEKYGVCKVDGRTSPVVKEAHKDRFRTRPDFRIMMGNVLSLGTGTDGLQDVCSYCLLAEADWVPGANEQCVDRLDRRGQVRSVNADILVAPGSISERVLASALRKRRVTHASLDRIVA